MLLTCNWYYNGQWCLRFCLRALVIFTSSRVLSLVNFGLSLRWAHIFKKDLLPAGCIVTTDLQLILRWTIMSIDFIHKPLLFSLLFGFKIKSILDSQCGSEYFCKKLILPAGCINEHSTNTQDYNWILAPSILAFILSIAGKIEEAQIKLRIQPFRSREGFRQFMDVPWENSGDKFKIDSGWYVTFASSAAP